MNARVYTNLGGSVPSSDNISTTSQPTLALFAEDRTTITDTFLRQLALCQLSSRRFRLVLTVFNQTIGFNKIEDDMNGVRLEQLTGISPNHANSTVRELEQLNVLIKRKGKYGHYLSINFAFSQWGQLNCTDAPNNDPCCLLPDDEQSDAGLDLNVAISDTEPEEAVSQPTEPQATVQTMQQPQGVDDEKLHELLQPLLDAIKTLSERVERLEKQYEQQPETQAPQTPITEPEEAPAVAEEPRQTPPPSAQKASFTPPPIPQNSTATVCSNTRSLRYPDSFNAQQRQQAAKCVQPAGDKAQLLLDMLSKRMAKQHDPLRQPLSYLDTLVEKLQNKQLTFTEPKVAFSTVTSSTTGFVPPPPSKEEQCHAEYREAAADCLHTERNLKMLAERENMSFEDMLIKANLQQWWADIKQRLYNAKAALAELQMGDVVAAT